MVKVKCTLTKENKKAIKPKYGKGSGGLFTARILAHTKKKDKENTGDKSNKKNEK